MGMKPLLFSAFAICCAMPAFSQQDIQRKFQTQFIETANNTVIELPAGHFTLTSSLWLDGKKGVTIRGKGMEQTILDFSGQSSGAEGIKVTNGANITIEGLTVQNTRGDGIKTQLVDTVVFRDVKADWTKGADSKNGGYGLYPVQCSEVLIEKCVAKGASDAGIYVGQSRNIIVRNSLAVENVAGIEIENSMYAEVYDNEATNNTGGILIFDLPDLIIKKGGYTKVYRNHVHHNNHVNFAPKGNIVGKVPQGTGIMVLATNHVDIFQNRIINNITSGTVIISYFITENPIKDSSYYPYPANINIYENTYAREHTKPTGKGRMGKLYRFKLRFGKDVPHIVYDGILDDKNPGGQAICIRNNENASFANIDAGNNFKQISRDMKAYACEGR